MGSAENWKFWLNGIVNNEEINRVAHTLQRHELDVAKLGNLHQDNLVKLGLPLGYAVKINEKAKKEVASLKRNVLKNGVDSSENNTVTLQITKRETGFGVDHGSQYGELNWKKWLTNSVDKSHIKYIVTTFISHGVLNPSYLDPLNTFSLVNMGIENKDAKNIMAKRQLEAWLSDVVSQKDVPLVVRACLQHNLDISTLKLLSSDSMVENIGIAFGDAIRIHEKAQKGQYKSGSSEASIKPSQSIKSADSVGTKKVNNGITLDSMADEGNNQSFLLADSDGGSTVKVVLSFDQKDKKVVEKREKEPTQNKKIKKGKKTAKVAKH